MPMLTGLVDSVIGVDTHKHSHKAALVDALGGVLETRDVSSDAAGYRALLEWAGSQAPGRRVWAIEGSDCYGAGLMAYLLEQGEWVCEVDRPKRPKRKGGVKSDEVDAVRAAREALAAKHLAHPRRRGDREAIRVLNVTRKQAVGLRTAAIDQLQALVVTAPDGLRSRLRSLSGEQLVRACARLRSQASQSNEWTATVMAMRSVAGRAQAAATEVAELERELAKLEQPHTELLAETGVGTVVTALLLSAWSHRGRLRSEAAFAMLGGSAPIEASSGEVKRHRLNRGGDRQLNSALHTVVLTRQRWDERTQAYFARRTAEGKSEREIRRCLKRYVARHLFRVMEAAARSN